MMSTSTLRRDRFTPRSPVGFAAGDANLYRYVGNSPTNRTDPSGLFDEKLFWEYVKRLNPEVYFWWKLVIGGRGKIVQRDAGWNPLNGAILTKKVRGTSTEIDGVLTDILYLHEGFSEGEAAEAFIAHMLDPGSYFGSRYSARNADTPEGYKCWQEAFKREMAKAALEGVSWIGTFYSLQLKGVDWAITATNVVNGTIDPTDYLTILRTLPLMKNSSIYIFDKAGKQIAKVTKAQAELLGSLKLPAAVSSKMLLGTGRVAGKIVGVQTLKEWAAVFAKRGVFFKLLIRLSRPVK